MHAQIARVVFLLVSGNFDGEPLSWSKQALNVDLKLLQILDLGGFMLQTRIESIPRCPEREGRCKVSVAMSPDMSDLLTRLRVLASLSSRSMRNSPWSAQAQPYVG